MCAKDTKYENLAKEFVPENTGKSTNWAVKNFNDWCTNRNSHFPDSPCHEDLLTNSPYDSKCLCYWLCHFITATRQKDGKKYKPDQSKELESNAVNKLCRVLQLRSFAPKLTTLFGNVTYCVINVNFGEPLENY